MCKLWKDNGVKGSFQSLKPQDRRELQEDIEDILEEEIEDAEIFQEDSP